MKSVLLALSIALFLSATASAQVAVYRLNFSPSGDNINYRAFQNGYYISPVQGGTGALILVQNGTGSSKLYYTYNNFGETFFASNGNTKRMVLTATSSNTISNTTFYAIGSLDYAIHLTTALPTPATSTASTTGINYIAPVATTTNAGTGTGTTAITTIPTAAQIAGGAAAPHLTQPHVASTMRGYEITSDSQSDLVFAGNTTTQGVAGVSTMNVSLQTDMTTYALTQNYSLAGEVAYIQNLLQNQGYSDGSANTTTTGTTGTTGTTTGTTGTTSNGTTTTATSPTGN